MATWARGAMPEIWPRAVPNRVCTDPLVTGGDRGGVRAYGPLSSRPELKRPS